MPQGYGNLKGHTRSSPYRLRQDLGYVPSRGMAEGDGGGGITSTGGPSSPVLTLTPIPTGKFLGNLSGADAVPVATDFAFLKLNDTPSSYAGQALKVVRVNAAANALEFAVGGSGGASWLPTVNGAEPPLFITDGAGGLIAVAYAP